MKLVRLVNFKEGRFKPVSATITDDGRHYNITHGQKSKNTWEIKIGVDDKMVKKNIENSDPVIELNEEYYVFKPIYNIHTKELVKDAKGYEKYYLSVNVDNDKEGVVVFINVPTINTKHIKYEYHGNCTILSVGTDTSIVNNNTYICDAPVVMMSLHSSVTIHEEDETGKENVYKLSYNGELELKGL